MRYRGETRPVIRRGSIRESFAGGSNLKGCWSLDGHARDESGNGNHGTISGAISYPGKFRLGHLFDGSDDYINIGDVSSFELNTFSILAWVKRNSIGTEDQIISVQQQSQIAGGICGYDYGFNTSNQLFFEPVFANTWYNYVTASTFVNTSDFYFTVLTKSGTSLKIYVKGNLDYATTLADSTIDFSTTTTKKTAIGGRWRGVTADYTGFMAGTECETAILSRELSPSEISQYYQESILEPRKYWFYSPAVGGVIVPWHLFPQNTLGQGVA